MDKYLTLAKTSYDKADKIIAGEIANIDGIKSNAYLSDYLMFAFDITLQYSLLELSLLDEEVAVSEIKQFITVCNHADLYKFIEMTQSKQIDIVDSKSLAEIHEIIVDAIDGAKQVVKYMDKKVKKDFTAHITNCLAAFLHIDEITDDDRILLGKTQIFHN